MSSAGRSHRTFRRIRERLRVELPPVCSLCGQPIDLGLTHPDPLSWVLDHVTPLALGGDPHDEANLRPAHKRCNERKGKGAAPEPPRFTRRWR